MTETKKLISQIKKVNLYKRNLVHVSIFSQCFPFLLEEK